MRPIGRVKPVHESVVGVEDERRRQVTDLEEEADQRRQSGQHRERTSRLDEQLESELVAEGH